MLNITRLSAAREDFWTSLEALISWDAAAELTVSTEVDDIIAQVKAHGDAALLKFSRRFDGMNAKTVSDLEVSPERLHEALHAVPDHERVALRYAADRIAAHAERQKLSSWKFTEPDGSVFGQHVTPLDSVGLYVPGGKASYPSSVLMNATPAKVAGVESLVMMVPAPGGEVGELVLAAAAIAGVDRVFRIGGAHAIAALAYGTQTIPRVDKIVGPGNIYVATAKRKVFGAVGIDMVAGPSEVLVVCDKSTDPDWIAMDVFAQAEHDEDARALVVSPDLELLEAIHARMEFLLPTLERSTTIQESLIRRGALIHVRDLAQATRVINFVAPEHLELAVVDPAALLPNIRHAGAIFLGPYSPEVLGDYCAGPNHVLPTSRTARFASPLGVYDFQKRSSVIHCSQEGARGLAATASILARSEGLTAHARSAELRAANVK